MKHLIITLSLLLVSVWSNAQIHVLQEGSIEGPYPMGKEGYPTIDGKTIKSATKVFVSTAGVQIDEFVVDTPGLLLYTDKVIGGYDLWFNPALSKNSKLTIKTSSGQTIFSTLAEKKNKLKSDKKYIIYLTSEGQDQNEGYAYLILRTTSDAKVEISGKNYNQSHLVKASQSKSIKLQYGSYTVKDNNGKNYNVKLRNKPVIVEL